MTIGGGAIERCAALVVLALWALVGAPAPVAGETPPGPGRQVLLLYTEPRLTPAIVAVDTAFRSTMESRSPVPVSFYTEYLDLNLFDGTQPVAELRELLRRKYATRHLDVILTGGSRALRIAVHNRADLFSNAPVVFAAVDPTAAADLRSATDVTGTFLHLGWRETLDLARRFQPDLRQAVVVTGSSPADQVWMAAARRQLASTGLPIDVTYRSGPSLGDFLSEVKSLPGQTVVMVGAFLRDATGRDLATPDVVTRIAGASRVPVYTLNEAAVGTGAVGGQVVSFETHGKTAADLALRILAGERPAATDTGTTLPVVDARQLTRWRFDASRVPAGGRVLFHEPSVWARYRWYILGAFGVLLAQSALIGALLVQRLERQRAARAERESQAAIRDLAGRLMTAQEEERRRIARDLHDDVNQELAAQSIALGTLGERLPEDTKPAVLEEIARLQARTVELANGIRDLSHSLHPGVLQHAGLVPALRGYCRRFEKEHGLTVTFEANGELATVPPDVSLCLYRVTQEGLGNVARHATAQQARVTVSRDGDGVVLTIGDDGRGFDLVEARRAHGLGLISLDERVRLLGGHLIITSTPQRGTELRITIPLNAREHAPRHRIAG